MRKFTGITIVLTVFGCYIWFGQTLHSEAKINTLPPVPDSNEPIFELSAVFIEKYVSIDGEVFEHICMNSLENKGLKFIQQVGAKCVAVPRCPDCGGDGNVCRGAEEFYPGITMALAKRSIIAKCQRANGLDYCGGSRGCVKKTRSEQDRHRQQYGGGCYKQCEKVAACVYLTNR